MRSYSRKVCCLFISLTLLFSFCLVRLVWIQLIQHRYFSLRAVNQRRQTLNADLNHGKILDRNGVSLERDLEYVPWVAVFPDLLDDEGRQEVSDLLADLSPADQADVERFLEQGKPFLWPCQFDSQTVDRLIDSSPPGVMVVSVRPAGLPGLNYSVRQYLAAHTLGFYQQDKAYGLCLQFADYLKSPGPCRVSLFSDASGKLLPQHTIYFSSSTDSARPYHVVTTLDREWQSLIEQKLESWCSQNDYPFGSVVAVDAATGGILAISSYPHIPEDWNNHALQAYTPGSIFKIVVAAAALCEGKVAPWDRFYCSGEFDVGDRIMHCWSAEGHGHQSLAEALANSCNVAFVELGRRLGNDVIIRYAAKLGLGRSLKYIYGDSHGNLPNVTPDTRFNPNYPIGQGEITVTPVQIASLLSTVVNDGIEMPLYLVDRIIDNQGCTVKNLRPNGSLRQLPRLVSYRLQDMLTLAVTDGTAASARLAGVPILGKTGSAENGTETADCWFAGAAKIKGRWIVLVVYVARGGSSAESAVPLFRSIVECLLEQH